MALQLLMQIDVRAGIVQPERTAYTYPEGNYDYWCLLTPMGVSGGAADGTLLRMDLHI
jgi:hypothetical protein